MSNAPFYRQGQCNETTGFLFSHDCGEPSDHVCGECQKPICGKHAVDTQGTIRCTTCAKKWMRTSGQTNTPVVGDSYPGGYYGSPYFYTWHHYGSSYDDYRYRDRRGHHFQDGDEGALRGSEPTRAELEDFENDMGAS